MEKIKGFYECDMKDVKEALKNGLIRVDGLHKDSEEIIFYGKSGFAVRFYHEQNCCENVSVESIDNEEDIYTDTDFCQIVESTNTNEDDGNSDISYTWTFYLIKTDKGYSTIRWYGESNGYYSESVQYEIYQHDLCKCSSYNQTTMENYIYYACLLLENGKKFDEFFSDKDLKNYAEKTGIDLSQMYTIAKYINENFERKL